MQDSSDPLDTGKPRRHGIKRFRPRGGETGPAEAPVETWTPRVEGDVARTGHVLQPLQEYAVPLDDESAPMGGYTHLGTDYGRMGPGQDDLRWKKRGASGQVCADLAAAGWTGLWHSLAGLRDEEDRYLDFNKCYPYVRDDYQPKCVGMVIRVQGSGTLRLELKSPEERVLWWATRELATGNEWLELSLSWLPSELRRVKSLSWVAEPGAHLCVGSIHLVMEMPQVTLAEKVFLVSYAKLARSYSPNTGMVRDCAHTPEGRSDSIAASGLFCLATCAAWKMGMVKRSFAEQVLRKTHATISGAPRAMGLLPQHIQRHGEKYKIVAGGEYSTIATSLYYHGAFLAAQMIWDAKTLVGLIKAVREVEFDRLRDRQGYVGKGLAGDGRTLLAPSWRDWGGETVLVLLLEHMAAGSEAQLRMDKTGSVPGGVGYLAEIQSLFYPDFSYDVPDSVSEAVWLTARRDHLAEQKGYFPGRWPGSAAASLGLYGLSAGQGARGVGHVANGTRQPGKAELIHPHYILMSGSLEPDPGACYDLLAKLEAHGLMPPWGMVENFSKDLEYLPTLVSLSGAFECIAAYHLWTRATGELDAIYDSADHCPLLREAIRAFYPPRSTW
ncbi:MAG: hypothetical protein A2133_05040 [Actinobacteria bacterium RBG_16_64_13]|nr:MAG: hypothetical protein A2133_05040 [Actinobacteria bacterium RBG_16_64_13]